MNKTMIGKLIALGATVTLIAGFGTVNYNSETGTDLAKKIGELKQLAITWKNNSTAKDELISQKEQELSVLQGKYNSILSMLGISDMNADENTIKEAINSMSNAQDLKDIATALGISDTASKEDIINEIAVMGETMTTLKDSIDTLESTVGQLKAEIERLQGEVNKANNAESVMLAEVATALNDIGTPVVEEAEPTLEELQAELDRIWNEFSTLVANDSTKFTEGRRTKIKDGYFTLDNSDGYKVKIENGSIITVETNEQIYNLLSQYKEKLDLYNSLAQQ